jgi:hypothetical protein
MAASIDIQRMAWLMIRRYGDEAVSRAAERGDVLLSRGEMYGVLAWIAIIRAIERLQATEPREEDTLQ